MPWMTKPTVTVTAPALLLATGSGVEDEVLADTLFCAWLLLNAVTANTRVALTAVAPAQVQVMVPELPTCGVVQVAPVAVSEVKRKSGDNTIDTTTFCASLGPKFWLVAVKVTGVLTLVCVADGTKLIKRRSASVMTAVVVEAALLAALTSVVVLDTVALAVITEPVNTDGDTVYTNVAEPEAPAANAPMAPLPEVSVRPVGVGKATVTPVALLGPLLVTVAT